MTPTDLAAERANQRNALIAGFLGWTLDAFDFFILTFVLSRVAKDFNVDMLHMSYTILASLAMRPVGAFIFGLMADRYGRRLPLMIDVVFYSVVEVLSGLAPNYTVFLILRLLYGIGMGGEWGVGASLVMESVPAKWRGILSGMLQEGYALGNLLAAGAYYLVFPHWGWRVMFFIGGLPALLSLFIRAKVKEPKVWSESHTKDWSAYRSAIFRHWKLFLYLVLLMAMMNFISHGTQDLYPTFLQQARFFNTHMTAIITMISMVGAIAGGLSFGLFSDRRGRRRSMVIALVAAVVVIPLWMFAPNTPLIMVGAFMMQFMVQGAWGVIPVHINELSPNELRGFFPGFAYQVGVLIASTASTIEVSIGKHLGLAKTMGIFAATVFIIGAIVIALGPEAKGVEFGEERPAHLNANQQRAMSPRFGYGILGFAIGGFIGYLLRPSAIVVGQLPFVTVILRGANLQGIDQLLVPLAQTSFNVLVAGAIIGAVLGVALGSLMKSKKGDA